MADYFGLDYFREEIPIIISLQYGHRYLQFPINPNELEKEIPSESEKADVEGIGEVANPSSTKLARMTIRSFFWQDRDTNPSSYYVDWLEKWQASKKPAKLIVTRLNYSMYVTCENFVHKIKAGEEKDVYFTLDLQEYRPFGAKRLKVKEKFDLFGSAINFVGNLATSILIPIPRPDRFQNKEIFENPYSTKEEETVMSITKKIKGDTSSWKELYDENKKVLGDFIGKGEDIPAGTKLNLPNGWIK